MKQFAFLLVLALLTATDSAVAQWVQVGPSGLTIYSLAADGSNVFAGTFQNGVYRSTDYGQTWIQTPLNSGTIACIMMNGSSIFAGTFGSGLYRSTDNGGTWSQTTLNNPTVRVLVANGSNMFAGTSGGVYLSADNGQTWAQTSLSNRTTFCIAVRGSYVFAGTDSGVYVSANNGQSWTQTALNNIWIKSIVATSTTVVAGTWEEGLYFSLDNGATWSHSSALYDIPVLTIRGSEVLAGANGVYRSRDNGLNWERVSEGLGYYSVLALAVSENYVYAGLVLGYSVWRRPTPEIITSVQHSSEVPGEFLLEQNYPNPFNPSTTISYQLPRESHVTLNVFDALGREVATLVDDVEEVGYKSVQFEASNLSSGMYFYRLQAGDFVATKKLLLLK